MIKELEPYCYGEKLFFPITHYDGDTGEYYDFGVEIDLEKKIARLISYRITSGELRIVEDYFDDLEEAVEFVKDWGFLNEKELEELERLVRNL